MQWLDALVITLHVLAATVWAGGHLVLALVVLPRALSLGAPDVIREFEAGYERLGLPALAVLVVTGGWLLYRLLPGVEGAARIHVYALSGLKVLLVLATVVLAADARLRIMPRLEPATLRPLARHIRAVTVLAVLLVIAGVGLHVGPR